MSHLYPNDIIPRRVKDDEVLNPYIMFKYSIRSEDTRKYYDRRLRVFLDFIQFRSAVKDMEKRCSDFVVIARNDYGWVFNQTIKFFHFQKGRVERGEIKAATLRRELVTPSYHIPRAVGPFD